MNSISWNRKKNLHKATLRFHRAQHATGPKKKKQNLCTHLLLYRATTGRKQQRTDIYLSQKQYKNNILLFIKRVYAVKRPITKWFDFLNEKILQIFSKLPLTFLLCLCNKYRVTTIREGRDIIIHTNFTLRKIKLF